MENASKALIIAGAILLSILLISLGIMVYTNAKGTIGNTNLDSEEIQTFNTKISQYCGKKKTANDMNALVSAISAINGAQNGKSDKHCVEIEANVDANYFTGDKASGYSTTTANNNKTVTKVSTNYPNFSSGKTYEAKYEVDDEGYIIKVIIN